MSQRAEYAPWVVLYPFLVLLLLGRAGAAVLLVLYSGAMLAFVLAPGRGFMPMSDKTQGNLVANLLFASFTAGVIQALATFVNRRALRSMAEFRGRLEANRLGIESVPFDPGETIRAAAELFRAPAERKGLAFSCVVAPGVPTRILGDPHRTSQILHNLLSNAVRHTASGGIEVRVEPADRGRTLRLEVRDSGCGIARADQERIFEEFTQLGSYATREHGGTGLGLAIARRLAGMMGGRSGWRASPAGGRRSS